MFNPSDLKLDSLPWLPLRAVAAFPQQPAIHFAIDAQNVVQYIGRSINPRQRWSQHHCYSQLKAIGNVRIAYLFIDDTPEMLSEIEAALIKWFDPPLNGAPVPPYDPPPQPIDENDLVELQAIAAMRIDWTGTAIHQSTLPVFQETFNRYVCLELIGGGREISIPKDKATLMPLEASSLERTYRLPKRQAEMLS
ncbi:MAG: GIY-YIG nuclease family protein [Myxacorys chilensis ATA2-1-KO14]|jgi:hypothetical protein|nr:GIY-YIG nuclease family protein [Myxacorys chilensis ATA2-1-KO14]